MTDSWTIRNITVIRLTENIPLTNWSRMMIDGVEFKPYPIMDAGKNVISVEGRYDFTGKEVEFV